MTRLHALAFGSLVAVCSALRVLPNRANLHAPAAKFFGATSRSGLRCVTLAAFGEEKVFEPPTSWTEEQRKSYMDYVNLGTDGGGWEGAAVNEGRAAHPALPQLGLAASQRPIRHGRAA